MIYLDTSALLKLFVHEPESSALSHWLTQQTGTRVVTSELTRLETLRACRREYVDLLLQAQAFLGFLDVVALAGDILEDAVHVGTPTLRSLDAIQLASALAIEEELTAFVVYDERLFEAAAAAGLRPIRPGA